MSTLFQAVNSTATTTNGAVTNLTSMSKNVDLYYKEMKKAIFRNFKLFDINKREYRYAKSKLHLIMAGEK